LWKFSRPHLGNYPLSDLKIGNLQSVTGLERALGETKQNVLKRAATR
jgi:hypothetical protein